MWYTIRKRRSIGAFIIDVFLDVLRFRKSCMRSSDTTANTELAAKIQVLSLVSFVYRLSVMHSNNVHDFLVFRLACHGNGRYDL
jgi:hypothetical protein